MSQAIRWVVETLQNDYELALARKWEFIKEKIIAPWTLGRNYQLIEIRGVPNRGISHRSGDRTAAVPSARRWWEEIRRGRKSGTTSNVCGLCRSGHRRGAVGSRDSSLFRHRSRRDMKLFDRRGIETNSYEPARLRKEKLEGDLFCHQSGTHAERRFLRKNLERNRKW